MEKQPMYEGKAKRVYKTDVDGELLVYFKDDATAFNGEKKGTIVFIIAETSIDKESEQFRTDDSSGI